MGSWSVHVHFGDVCSCLLNCRDLDPAAVDIPVIACVNLVSWNSFSKDDPLWRERERGVKLLLRSISFSLLAITS